jgi:[acyl-carrier-protein] S-malonyltransferase
MSIAFVFPGQGSQVVGMGKDLVALPTAQRIFAEADQVLGFPLSQLMFEGPKESLDDTIHTQPALFTMSVALYALLGSKQAAFVAGHSLGEYAALYAAGVLSFADGLRLVRERGRLMKAAGAKNPGGMAAIIGFDDATVKGICDSIDGVQVANYNSPGQVVISGTKEGVFAAMQTAKERKARLVTALDVSIAAHSALMRSAVAEFAAAVNATPMQAPRIPVIANISAQPLASVEAICEELIGQLTSSVRWTQTIEYMAAQGVDTFVEIGPGRVLTGLIKRIAKNARLVNVSDRTSLESGF